MEQHDDVGAGKARAYRTRSRIARWAARIGMILCGSMIVTVLTSEPRIMAEIERGSGVIAALLSGDDADVGPGPDGRAAPETRPAVRQMPQSRIPVRRLGGDG
jgi:hypothetical protein